MAFCADGAPPSWGVAPSSRTVGASAVLFIATQSNYLYHTYQAAIGITNHTFTYHISLTTMKILKGAVSLLALSIYPVTTIASSATSEVDVGRRRQLRHTVSLDDRTSQRLADLAL